MKRTFSFLVVLALLLSLFGCVTAESNADGVIEITNDHSIYMKYSTLNRERNYTIDAESPLAVQVDVVTTSGTLKLTIGQENEEPVYTGNLTEDSSFTVYIPSEGKYAVTAVGENHSGSFNLQWAETDAPVSTTVPTTVEEEPGTEPTTIPAKEAVLTIDYAQDPADYDDAGDSEYGTVVVLQTDTPIQNFQYLHVTLDVDEDGKFSCTDSETMYTKSLTPDTPCTVRLVFDGALPNRAVSYVDGCGQTHLFAITMSGENGDALLMEVK